jgi:hypothetical protein
MNKPVVLPNVESNPDARSVEACRSVSMVDRSLIGLMFDHSRIEDITAMVDEMYVVLMHRSVQRECGPAHQLDQQPADERPTQGHRREDANRRTWTTEQYAI